jgi:hypothetical protein
MEKSPTDTYPMRIIKVGEVVTPSSGDHSVTVLARWLIRPSDIDAYAVWVVLCHLPHNDRHPFAVWTAYDRPEGWSLANGDYCMDIREAVTTYESRGGKYSL